MTLHDGIRTSEIGFALIAVAGGVFVLSELGEMWRQSASLVAGACLAVGAVLVIVALHWGHVGL